MGLFEPEIMGLQIITDDKNIKVFLEKYHLLSLEILGYDHPCLKENSLKERKEIRFENIKHYGNDIIINSIINEYNPELDLLADFPVFRIYIVSTESEFEIASNMSAWHLIICLSDFSIRSNCNADCIYIKEKMTAAKFVRAYYHYTNSRHLYPYDCADITPNGVSDLVDCFEADSFESLALEFKKRQNLYGTNIYVTLSEISDKYEQAKKNENGNLETLPFDMVDKILNDFKGDISILNCYTKEIHYNYCIAFVFKVRDPKSKYSMDDFENLIHSFDKK